MLHDVHLGIRLPFETPQEQAHSEDILDRLLGIMCRVNLQYLLRNPQTPALYDSGVRYTPPDQASRPPLPRAKVQKLLQLLRDMDQEPETALLVLRILRGVEIFLDIPSLYRRGKGDCNELAPVRVAELWRAGIMARAYLTKAPNGNGITYHSIVQHADGSSEDPSLILGMGGPARAAERAEEIRKNKERWTIYMAAATQLIAAEGVPPAILGRQIDQMGLVPRTGFPPYVEAA